MLSLTWLRLSARDVIRATLVVGLVIVIFFASRIFIKHILAGREYRRAESYLKQFQPEKALPHLRQSIALRPDNASAHLLAAHTLRLLGEFDLADTHLEICRGVAGGTFEGLQLEELLLLASRGETKESRSSLSAYVQEATPQEPLVLEAMAVGYLQKAQHGRARACVDKWVELEPTNPRAYLLRGKLFSSMVNHGFARGELERAVELDPDSILARRALATTLLDLGVWGRATAELEWVRARQPLDEELPLKLAICYREQGKFPESLELLQALLDANPDNRPAFYYKALTLLTQNRVPEAIQAFEQLLQHDRNYAETHFHLSQCYRRVGRQAEAEMHEQAFKRLDEDFRRLAAIRDDELPSSPKNPDLYHEMATIYYRSGKSYRAVQNLKWALQFDSNHQPSHRLLAEYYNKIGDFDLAIEHSKKTTPR